MDNNVKDLINKAVETQDQTDVSSDFAYELAPAGVTMARFIEYIELGKQKQRHHQGQAKADCEMVRIVFELLSPQHIKEIEVEGKPVKITNKIFLTIPLKMHNKAKFTKLLKLMKYGRDDITHMAQMLGEGFVLTLFHNEVGEGDQKKTYVNLNTDGGDYQVGSPNFTNPATGEVTEVPVPPPMADVRIFLWDNPTVESWASLFIDGTRTETKEGKEVEVSKNWLQESILDKATDLAGSALENLLSGANELPDITQEAPAEVPVDTQEVADAKKTAKKQSAAKTAAVKIDSKKPTADTSATSATTSPSKEEPVETPEEDPAAIDPMVALGLA